ncbi:unnamed protein product [Closterium sp. NIES-64]|nr:unnamed protein product [Closterium sp. NIES-64]CAI5975895.1 unnamed protein product [Closterium sp. NIES-65]
MNAAAARCGLKRSRQVAWHDLLAGVSNQDRVTRADNPGIAGAFFDTAFDFRFVRNIARPPFSKNPVCRHLRRGCAFSLLRQLPLVHRPPKELELPPEDLQLPPKELQLPPEESERGTGGSDVGVRGVAVDPDLKLIAIVFPQSQVTSPTFLLCPFPSIRFPPLLPHSLPFVSLHFSPIPFHSFPSTSPPFPSIRFPPLLPHSLPFVSLHFSPIPFHPFPSTSPSSPVSFQFHACRENDQFWGVNFSEWDNVKRSFFHPTTFRPVAHPIGPATPPEPPHTALHFISTPILNALPISHPLSPLSGGYYNFLSRSHRRRTSALARAYGFHGLCYHHYWFGCRRTTLAEPLLRMLEDGEPNLPFCLIWANEPWTNRWDGAKAGGNGVLLEQTYGDEECWKEHFDWLLKFFNHPNYIKVCCATPFWVGR